MAGDRLKVLKLTYTEELANREVETKMAKAGVDTKSYQGRFTIMVFF